jgi:hypothetical protein
MISRARCSSRGAFTPRSRPTMLEPIGDTSGFFRETRKVRADDAIDRPLARPGNDTP